MQKQQECASAVTHHPRAPLSGEEALSCQDDVGGPRGRGQEAEHWPGLRKNR